MSRLPGAGARRASTALARERVERVRHRGDARERAGSPRRSARPGSRSRPSARGASAPPTSRRRRRCASSRRNSSPSSGCRVISSALVGRERARLLDDRRAAARACRCPGGRGPMPELVAGVSPASSLRPISRPIDGRVDRVLDEARGAELVRGSSVPGAATSATIRRAASVQLVEAARGAAACPASGLPRRRRGASAARAPCARAERQRHRGSLGLHPGVIGSRASSPSGG